MSDLNNDQKPQEEEQKIPPEQQEEKRPESEPERKPEPEEQDPYTFFKLSLENEDEGKNENGDGNKPHHFPFFTMLLATVAALAFINMFIIH